MSLITIFTSPKPFTKSEHIATIQRNAIESWTHLVDDVTVLMIGDEEGMVDVAAELGVMHVREVRTNRMGTPLIPDMFDIARKTTDSPILAFANADVILTDSLVKSVKMAMAQERDFLLVGQRYDIAIDAPIDFSDGWQARLMALNQEIGRLHGPYGSDYFVFPRHCFVDVPELAIGRAGWDNWMIYEARQCGWKTIDGTATIFALHQNHDYSHLPGGQVHYRLPESNDNVVAAGGNLHIFPLTDANWRMDDGGIDRQPMTWHRFWREVEIFPLVHWHSELLGKVFHYCLHPKRGWEAVKAWLARRFHRTSSIKEE
jgi:hypothetical protein